MPTLRKPPTTIEYSIHPLALDVFHFISDRYQPILRWNTFPDSLKSALLQQQVYTGIMHSEKIPKPNSDETLKKAVKYQFITPMHRHLHKLAQTLYTLTKISTGYLGQPL